mgnify:CR=1 FL=1
MSEELNPADANLHALHAERAALRQAAQTAGIVVWLDGDTYHAALNGTEATGATLGAALVGLCVALGEREATTRADLDTLRDGVAWLGGELERVKAWAGVWKYKAKGQWNRAEWWRWRHGDVRRAARLLVSAWRQAEKNEATARSMGWELYGLLKDWQTCEKMWQPEDTPCGVCQICRALAFWKTMYRKDLVQRTPEVEPPQNDAETDDARQLSRGAPPIRPEPF